MKRARLLALCLLLAAVPAAAQDVRRTSPHDSFWYGRFGYGTIVNDAAFGGVALGFGRRLERGALGLDLLLFSAQMKIFGTGPEDLHQIGGVYTHAGAASVATVKALYFVGPSARTTPYIGIGAGWGAVSFGRSVDIDERWHGMGLQGEFTVGYAFARSAVSTRFFVQADMTRPFYKAKRYSDRVVVTGDRHAPSLVVSLGSGW
jgi:opacity protein-like surface antigen